MYASERILEEFYEALADQNESRLRVHIPRSDVFYIREKSIKTQEPSTLWTELNELCTLKGI